MTLGDQVLVSIYDSGAGIPGSRLYDLASPFPIVVDARHVFLAPPDAALDPMTDYFVVVESLSMDTFFHVGRYDFRRRGRGRGQRLEHPQLPA